MCVCVCARLIFLCANQEKPGGFRSESSDLRAVCVHQRNPDVTAGGKVRAAASQNMVEKCILPHGWALQTVTLSAAAAPGDQLVLGVALNLITIIHYGLVRL